MHRIPLAIKISHLYSYPHFSIFHSPGEVNSESLSHFLWRSEKRLASSSKTSSQKNFARKVIIVTVELDFSVFPFVWPCQRVKIVKNVFFTFFTWNPVPGLNIYWKARQKPNTFLESIGELNILVWSFRPSVTSSSGSKIELERDFCSKKHYFRASKTQNILDVVINFADIVELLRF